MISNLVSKTLLMLQIVLRKTSQVYYMFDWRLHSLDCNLLEDTGWMQLHYCIGSVRTLNAWEFLLSLHCIFPMFLFGKISPQVEGVVLISQFSPAVLELGQQDHVIISIRIAKFMILLASSGTYYCIKLCLKGLLFCLLVHNWIRIMYLVLFVCFLQWYSLLKKGRGGLVG